MQSVSRNPYDALFKGDLSFLCCNLTLPTSVQNLTTVHSLSRSRAHQNLNRLRDLTTSLSGMICHPWASTCHDRPMYQI